MGAWYASRESVMDALDIKAAAYTSGQVDRAIESSSRKVEGLTRRIFYPLTATKSWDFPNDQAESWTLWLDANELVSVFSFVSGGTAVPAANFNLEPNQYGPPYDRIEINRGTSSTFNSGPLTPQRSLVVNGVFSGCPADELSEGTLTAGITSSATSLVASRPVGVGRILRIDSERMLVTERTFATSAQTIQTPLTANLSNTILAVTDGTQFALRESLLIDAERMLVVDIAGNNLIVKRAQQGSVLATHSGSTVYWARTLTVTRGALGTTAGAHSLAAPVVRHVVPGAVEELTIAYCLARLLGESGGYSRQVGSGSSETSGTSSVSIKGLEDQVVALHGRLARMRAV